MQYNTLVGIFRRLWWTDHHCVLAHLYHQEKDKDIVGICHQRDGCPATYLFPFGPRSDILKLQMRLVEKMGKGAPLSDTLGKGESISQLSIHQHSRSSISKQSGYHGDELMIGPHVYKRLQNKVPFQSIIGFLRVNLEEKVVIFWFFCIFYHFPQNNNSIEDESAPNKSFLLFPYPTR